jgi:hypothetical protein
MFVHIALDRPHRKVVLIHLLVNSTPVNSRKSSLLADNMLANGPRSAKFAARRIWSSAPLRRSVVGRSDKAFSRRHCVLTDRERAAWRMRGNYRRWKTDSKLIAHNSKACDVFTQLGKELGNTSSFS